MGDCVIGKIENEGLLKEGFMRREVLGGGIVDMEMEWVRRMEGLEVVEFEKELMEKVGVIGEIGGGYGCS